MSAPECAHGAPIGVECPACERAADQGHAPVRPPRTVRLFPARWSSNCGECFALILPGDQIGPLPDSDEFGCSECVRDLS